ncbi:hypothetical protein FEM48_Zijuj02G0012100 [Ziziphus jujuba var. spinosa]|uniref:Uncharacterized protein n=1 Tax=Ziziphus jujuba var. spinosa TaxID=714518 RepID=A0A978VSR4_ZIZJJ|nr:hypothetical protein FEM48_Zijuj02G0012100 [Ziziphus jujuba var. spinosa]
MQNHTMVMETDKDIKIVKRLAKLRWKGSVEVRGNKELATLRLDFGLLKLLSSILSKPYLDSSNCKSIVSNSSPHDFD